MRKLPAKSLMIGCYYNALDFSNLTRLRCLYVMFSGTTGDSYSLSRLFAILNLLHFLKVVVGCGSRRFDEVRCACAGCNES